MTFYLISYGTHNSSCTESYGRLKLNQNSQLKLNLNKTKIGYLKLFISNEECYTIAQRDSVYCKDLILERQKKGVFDDSLNVKG